MKAGERIVVTGAAGRIGSVVAARLANEGHELVLLDRRRADPALPDATFVECDLRDRDGVARAVAGASIVIHIGEVPNVGVDGLSGDEVFESNTAACRSMLDAAVAGGARRFIYTSSCQYYGYWGDKNFDRTKPPERWPIDELQPPAPLSGYARSKAANEAACRETSERSGIEVFAFRLPWVMPRGFEAKARQFWPRADEDVFDGFWTYVHVDDVAEAYALATRVGRPLEPLPTRCEAFQLMADDVRGPMSIREKLARHLPHWPALPDDWPERSPPVSSAKAARFLGWQPMIRMVDALAAS